MNVEKTINDLRDSIDFSSNELFSYSELHNQPVLLQKYFTSVSANSVNKPKFITVKQTAKFKTEPNSDWKPISAVQYFTTKQPNFLWFSQMESSSILWINAIDSYINGKGNMLIKLNSSITVADSWGVGCSGIFPKQFCFPLNYCRQKILSGVS